MKSIIHCSEEHCPGFWNLSYNQGGVLYPHYHYCDCDDPYDPIRNPKGCKNHRPDGCWRQTEDGLRRMCPKCMMMPLITLLRKISLHLDLVKASPGDERSNLRKYTWDREVAGAVFGTDAVALGGEVQTDRHLELVDVSSCGKLAVLKALLQKWAGDAKGSRSRPHKVLIFSNSVRMLKIVQRMADNAGWENIFMTGETPSEDRQTLVDSFNSESSTAFLFITSTPAGGVGLNLVGANRVVILDPSYSPAADLQAMDRAFRIGQLRDVSVYRLVAAGTIEELIYMRQMSKQQHSMVAVEGDVGQKRIFAGAKALPGMQGELWGFENLLGSLLNEAERVADGSVQAMEIMAAAEQHEAAGQAISDDTIGVNGGNREGGVGRIGGQVDAGQGFVIEQVPDEIVNAMDQEVVHTNADAGNAASFEGASGKCSHINDGVADPCLNGASGSKERAPKGSAPIDMNNNNAVGEHREEESISIVPGALGMETSPRNDEDGFDPGLAALLEGLNAPGVLGIVRHDAAMAPSKKSEAASKRALAKKRQAQVQEERKMVAAVAERAPPGSMLECLAAWQGWPIKDMAAALVGMAAAERAEMKERYKKSALQGLMPSSSRAS